MSQYQERTEKDCLNCGTIVQGRFCQQCGQENILPRESFWSMLTHFVYDITHFDGKFFSTVKYLLTRPGFLSLEYVQGRRANYLHPIRMYIFTSAFFFLVFFTLYSAGNLVPSDTEKLEQQRDQLQAARLNISDNLAKAKDPVEREAGKKVLATLDQELLSVEEKLAVKPPAPGPGNLVQAVKDSIQTHTDSSRRELRDKLARERVFEFDSTGEDAGVNFSRTDFDYKSVIAYKRMQQVLPADKKDGWLTRAFMTRIIAAVEAGEKQGERRFIQGFIDNLLHSFPKMLFVSLPLFALILQLLYSRRKELFFSDHAVFTLHLYNATFIFLLGLFGLAKLGDMTQWGIIGFLIFLSVLGIYFYMYKCMRRFYGQSRGKTITKFILLNMLSFVLMSILLIIFTVISASQLANEGTH